MGRIEVVLKDVVGWISSNKFKNSQCNYSNENDSPAQGLSYVRPTCQNGSLQVSQAPIVPPFLSLNTKIISILNFVSKTIEYVIGVVLNECSVTSHVCRKMRTKQMKFLFILSLDTVTQVLLIKRIQHHKESTQNQIHSQFIRFKWEMIFCETSQYYF